MRAASMEAKRRRNFALVWRKANSGSTCRCRARLTMVKSRSPTSETTASEAAAGREACSTGAPGDSSFPRKRSARARSRMVLDRLPQLGCFFFQLLEKAVGIRPIEAVLSRPRSELARFEQRRKRARDRVEQRAGAASGLRAIRLLCLLDSIPVAQHLSGIDRGVRLHSRLSHSPRSPGRQRHGGGGGSACDSGRQSHPRS